MQTKQDELEYQMFKTWFYFLIFIILLGSVFELVLFGIGWYYADEVECNLLYCKFTNTESYTTGEYYKIQTINNTTDFYYMKCIGVGKEMNCSERVKIGE